MKKNPIPNMLIYHHRIGLVVLLMVLAGFLWLDLREPGEGALAGPKPGSSALTPAPDVAEAGHPAALAPEASAEPPAEPLVAEAAFPTATLLDFPVETRAIVQAAETGHPIRVTLGEGDSARWQFRPTPSVAEGFAVSTGLPGDAPTVFRSYVARNVDGDVSAGHQAFLSVAGNRMALMVFRDDGILHVLQDEAGDWRIEMEQMHLQSTHACHLTEEGLYATPLSEVLVPWNETDWDQISVEPEWQASDGLNPQTGELTLADRPIPYGREYAESLRTIMDLFVVENAGPNTLDNTSALTARYLTLSASLHAMYENQLGLNFLMQELVLIVSGSDFESPEIYDSGSLGSAADLGPFGNWLDTHRLHSTYRWSLATKIGRVHNANGRAWLSTTNSAFGRNVNNASGFSLVGHEIGHNLGTNHTSGGIMNPSLNVSRDFFRLVLSVDPDVTGAKQTHNHLVTSVWLTGVGNVPRTHGMAPLRDPDQIPFANDNHAVTRAGEPIQIDVLANDSKSTPFGTANSVIRVIETSSVFPPHAGTLSHSETQVSFAPSSGFTGTAFFSYTIRGDLGNDGKGWLHKGDVAVQVEDPAAPAPQVTALRGPAATQHDNERVILTWEDQGNAPFAWEIQRSVNSGPFQAVADVAGTSPSWVDILITRSAAVQYRVRAKDNTGEAGAWGFSETVPAATDPHAFWDDFASGTLAGWDTWTNAPDSTAPNDALAPHFTFDVSNNRARLQAPGGVPRLGLLVRSVTQDLTQTGPLSLSASLQMTDAHTWHRVLAWIDDGGAVLWIGIERNRDNNNTRKVRLYGVNSLPEFFQEVGNFNSTAQLFQNNQNGNAGFVVDHRATLTVSPGGVGMTVVPMEIGNTSRRASPVSTLGQINPGLSNFTGVGRFALGGYANQPSGTSINFFASHVALSSLPVPQKYLPGLVDDTLRLKPGEAATLQPSANDIGPVLGYSLQSAPAGWQVHRQTHGSELWTIQSPPDAVPGVYEVILQSTADDYQSNNDGLTAFSSVFVTVESPAAQANDLHYTKYRGEGPFAFFPLSNDVHSGFHGLANVDPRTATNASAGVMNNSYRLLSATLLTPSLGTLEVVTLNAVVNGNLETRPTGELRFSWAAGAPSGTAEIQYSFIDSRGQQGTGTVHIRLLSADAPRITAHPLARTVEMGDPFSLSVTATGASLAYQWFRNGNVIPGATGAIYSVNPSAPSHDGTYQVEVSNTSGSVTSHAAVVALGVAGPDAPTNLTATAISGSRIDLAWTDPNDPLDPPDDFRIERSANGSSGWDLLTTVSGTTHSDTGLSGGSTWYYRLIAQRDGISSTPSAVASATTPADPAPPVITQHPQSQSVGEGQNATFSVAATGNPAPSYQWRKNGADLGGETADTLTLTNVLPTDAATYTVFVSNGVGNGVESNPATLTVTDPPPPAPATLTATAAASDQIDLAWSDASDLSDSFRIEHSNNGSTGWSTLATVPGTSTTHSDTGLSPQSTWYYRVIAQRGGLESDPSTVASATTPAAPAAPIIHVTRPLDGVAAIPSGVGLWILATVELDPAISSVNLQWTHHSGPGVVTFTRPQEASTGATFTSNGSHVLRLTADDGLKTSTRDILVEVGAISGVPELVQAVTWGSSYNMGRLGAAGGPGTNSGVTQASFGDFAGESASDSRRYRTLYSTTAPLINSGGADIGSRNFSYAYEQLTVDTGSIPSTGNLLLGPTASYSTSLDWRANATYTSILHVWEKTNFLNITSEDVVTFGDPTSALSVQIRSNQHSGTIRFVVRNGDIWYVSEQATTGTGAFTLSNPGSVSWSVFNPGNLEATPGSLWISNPSFAPRSFTDIQAVGFLINSLISSVSEHRIGFDNFTASLTIGGAANLGPQVDAGTLATANVGEAASLNGSASDDGEPAAPGEVVTEWGLESGPGAAPFGDAAALQTTVTFAAAGLHTLRLVADDGAVATFDLLTVTVETTVIVPPVLDGMVMTGTGQGLRLQTLSIYDYRLEYTDTLTGTFEWLPMGDWTPGNDGQLDFIDTTPVLDQRFYRLGIRHRQ